MKRVFKVSQDLKPYIRRILYERHISFKFFKEDDIWKVQVPLSGQRFHEVVQRAKCEKLSEDTGILHLTKKESEDETRTASILKEKGKSSFVIAGSK